ncbi:COX15/CtaA family protein [Glaciibacter psychrotolerans]|uniref:Cytochrome c oxidase assembly protein subunit 15 n=1 Tax=Glaciibacter psychrotolerans TaxID=670054 RepID=A0A7Z0ECZ7_9MICO|nr:COX15/CtaA family protein [Leifsonia psychrotolerans]NYJ19359.1 cytochrome c oxidase assembly protein subunit 15 [Leifsonia psychrotolerans]
MPRVVDTRIRVIAWVYLAAQILLVGTGGLVRLTSSGLGCPTWPACTADSLVNTPEMGIHGLIEFGNRLLGVALGILAIVAFLSVWRMRQTRPDLFRLTLFAGLGIPAQAFIGGISVWTQLNPYVVGLHFVISAILAGLCTAFVFRTYTEMGPRVVAVPRWYLIVTHLTSVVVALTVLVGIMTTGSGPHAGDANAPRNGLNSELLQHIHAWPAYTTFALTLVLLFAAFRLRLQTLPWAALLLVVELVQIGVGLLQARTGLPPLMVGIHMILSCVLVSALVSLILHLTKPAGLPTAVLTTDSSAAAPTDASTAAAGSV